MLGSIRPPPAQRGAIRVTRRYRSPARCILLSRPTVGPDRSGNVTAQLCKGTAFALTTAGVPRAMVRWPASDIAYGDPMTHRPACDRDKRRRPWP
jgi:hypothetical protein